MQTQSETSDTVYQHHGFVVNGVRHQAPADHADGRTLLRTSSFTPPSEHVLIQLLRPGTRSIGLDEVVDLTAPGREEFRAFKADRVFNFTLDETGYEWGAGEITEAELRDIAGVPDNKVIIIERKNEPDEVLAEGAMLDLKSRGVEHLKTKKRFVTVTYGDDNTPYKLEPREYTGAELATIFTIPAGYVVDLIVNGSFQVICADQKLRVKNGMHFISQPGKGSSS